jgi:EAL domain-containing protein (putative c-di-GMP-specific phosphodiesterase class I)
MPDFALTTWFHASNDASDNADDDFVWTTSGDSGSLLRRRSAAPPRIGEAQETVAEMHRRWLHHGGAATRAERVPKRQPEIADLLAAVQLDEFFLEYQPIVSLSTGRVKAFEALLRWQHPRRGLLGPDQFLDDAERSGALALLTPQIIGAALRAGADWNRRCDPRTPIAVSINLCGSQLRDPELVPTVSAALGSAGIAPDCVWFEITENTGARHALAHLETLNELRRLGAKLALDDFGTGCASIGCLRSLPIDALKIDRSLIIQAGRSESGARVLAASIEIAHALGIATVAEGIERPDQLEHARMLGCELGQGHYFAWPVSKANADQIASRRGPPRRPDTESPRHRVAGMRMGPVTRARVAAC